MSDPSPHAETELATAQRELAELERYISIEEKRLRARYLDADLNDAQIEADERSALRLRRRWEIAKNRVSNLGGEVG